MNLYGLGKLGQALMAAVRVAAMPAVAVLVTVAVPTLVGVASAVSSAENTEPSEPPLVERLRAEHAALQEAEVDFRLRRARGQLSAGEADDYQAYLDRLRQRVADDCVALERSGISPVPPDLPCAEIGAPGPAPAAIDPGHEHTDAERIAALDAELETALGEFDEMLLREQERVKAARPHSGGAFGGGAGADGEAAGGADGAGAGAGQGGDEGDGSTGSGTSGDGRDGSASGTRAGEGSGTDGASDGSAGAGGAGAGEGSAGGGRAGGQGGAGTPDGRGAHGRPADIPDGSDDDVVARQLREAAEKETDPELKAKLWDEYRRYKRGTG